MDVHEPATPEELRFRLTSVAQESRTESAAPEGPPQQRRESLADSLPTLRGRYSNKKTSGGTASVQCCRRRILPSPSCSTSPLVPSAAVFFWQWRWRWPRSPELACVPPGPDQ